MRWCKVLLSASYCAYLCVHVQSSVHTCTLWTYKYTYTQIHIPISSREPTNASAPQLIYFLLSRQRIDQLFTCIQEGTYDFPDREWAFISEDAKDLIRHLLVKDASQRYTAEMVLKHPWVAHGGPRTLLETPRVIRRNNSAKDLAAFAESANAMKRLVLCHQTYSTDFSLKPRLSSHREGEEIEMQFVLPATPTSASEAGSLSPPASMALSTSEKCLLALNAPIVDSKIAQPRMIRTTLSLGRSFAEPVLIGF